jgi:hypothetical protein
MQLPRRSLLLGWLLAPFGLKSAKATPAPAASPITNPDRRYTIVTGTTLFGCTHWNGLTPIAPDPAPPVHFANETKPEVCLRRISVFGEGDMSSWHNGRDTPFRVCVQQQVGTFDELVADYARALAAAINMFDPVDHPPLNDLAVHDAILAKHGIDKFTVVPPATPEFIAENRAKWDAHLKETA